MSETEVETCRTCGMNVAVYLGQCTACREEIITNEYPQLPHWIWEQASQNDREAAAVCSKCHSAISPTYRDVMTTHERECWQSAEIARSERGGEDNELLDVIEFCEGALLDHFASEEGLDVEAAARIAQMCSDVLVRHGRISAIVEVNKQPET